MTRGELEAHLRGIVAELEARIHRKLLERLDLYEFEADRSRNTESILLLENNIEDVCRELRVFEAENEALLKEVTGLVLRDLLVNQLIMDSDAAGYFDLAFELTTTNLPWTNSVWFRPVAFTNVAIHTNMGIGWLVSTGRCGCGKQILQQSTNLLDPAGGWHDIQTNPAPKDKNTWVVTPLPGTQGFYRVKMTP